MNQPPLHVIAINAAIEVILPSWLRDRALEICCAGNFAILRQILKMVGEDVNVNYRFAFKTINIFSNK